MDYYTFVTRGAMMIGLVSVILYFTRVFSLCLQHTVTLPLALLQMYIQPHRYGSKMRGLLGLSVLAVLYLGW